MRTEIRSLLTLFALASLLPAQPANLPAVASKAAAAFRARVDAVEAIKQGNPVAALARLRATVKRGAHAASEDVQLVGELCSIARELEATQPGSGRTTALTAVDEGARSKPRLSRQEAAAVEAQLGELHETVLGDPSRARSHYQSALALDATRRNARQGYDRITRLEALIQAKAGENAELRRRAR